MKIDKKMSDVLVDGNDPEITIEFEEEFDYDSVKVIAKVYRNGFLVKKDSILVTL